MTRPADKLARFGSDSVFATGDEAGLATRLKPSDGWLASGWLANTRLPARWFNWLVGVAIDYIAATADLSWKNWTPRSAVFLGSGSPKGLIVDSTGHVYLFGLISGGGTKIYRLDAQALDSVDVGPTGLGTDTTTHNMTSNELGVLLFAGEGATIGNNIRRSITYGAAWSTVATHAATPYISMCWDGSNFYALPRTGSTLGVSPSGSVWVASAGSMPGGWDFTLVEGFIRARGAGKLLVAPIVTSTGNVIISNDGGATWTESSAMFGASSTIADVRWNEGSGLWVALATNGRVSVSADGLTWSARTTLPNIPPGGSPVVRLATDGGGTWAVSCTHDDSVVSQQVLVSTDLGVTWQSVLLADGVIFPFAITHGGGAAKSFWVLSTAAGQTPLLWRSLAT